MSGKGGPMKSNTLRNLLWFLPAAAVYTACFSLNVGEAWFGTPAKWHHLAVTVVYILFWMVFAWNARSSKSMAWFCRVFSGLMLVASVIGLLSRTLLGDLLLIPALLLTPFSSIPLYGLRYFTSWTGLELVSIALSSLWLFYSLKKLP